MTISETATFLKISSKWLIPSTNGRLVLLLFLIGHLCCALLIWFDHGPGLQSWAALPIINGFATFWLLAKPPYRSSEVIPSWPGGRSGGGAAVSSNNDAQNHGASHVQAVTAPLAGDFNHWHPMPMHQREDGGWFIQELLAHGHHQYRNKPAVT
jgi:hypothetical protein